MIARMETLAPGRTGTHELTVDAARTARSLGSGDVEVFGTPALLAALEAAACRALDGVLADDMTSVGASVSLDHLAPSPIGARITATATLEAVDGKRLTFRCEAHDGETLVGRATHTRVLVARSRFA